MVKGDAVAARHRINCTSVLLLVCYIIGFIIGVGVGQGLVMVLLVIAAKETLATAVNMATITTVLTILFIYYLQKRFTCIASGMSKSGANKSTNLL